MTEAVTATPKIESEYIWYGLAALVIVLGVLYIIGHNNDGGNGGRGPDEPDPDPEPQPQQEQYV